MALLRQPDDRAGGHLRSDHGRTRPRDVRSAHLGSVRRRPRFRIAHLRLRRGSSEARVDLRLGRRRSQCVRSKHRPGRNVRCRGWHGTAPRRARTSNWRRWSIGGALGYDDVSAYRFDDDRATGEAEAIHGGLGIRKDLDGTGRGSASLQLSAGVQWNDVARRQSVFVDGIGRADSRSSCYGLSGKIGYSFGDGPIFIRPELDASLFSIGLHGFEEDRTCRTWVEHSTTKPGSRPHRRT